MELDLPAVIQAKKQLLEGRITYNLMEESYHPGIKVRGEWSYFEDPEVKPAILRLFRHSKAISKTQYSVIADINQYLQEHQSVSCSHPF